ncbi:MAG: cyclic nucleotide-binding domain-containing protein [Candidatus Omnitrophica bacterium]|nr:cyclic nucleotide-binding domain-containing protein [Candidatus Omnitrophota bacterium]MDD5654754.1 cyclic nucleotide-binding domain-containing protein [Candidatus Omnitrophota bacterium]
METLEPILRQHSFFKDIPPQYIDFVVGCTSHMVFKAGDEILKEGEPADKFYLIRSGHVAVYIAKPSEITIETIHENDILGWSWLIPPYRYRFSAKAVENTRVLALDGKCLREKCESNPDLGYTLLKKIISILTERLDATRVRLLDIYNINADK